jgi:hypothetical protein
MVLPTNTRLRRSKYIHTGGGWKKAGTPVKLGSNINHRFLFPNCGNCYMKYNSPAKVLKTEMNLNDDRKKINVFFDKKLDSTIDTTKETFKNLFVITSYYSSYTKKLNIKTINFDDKILTITLSNDYYASDNESYLKINYIRGEDNDILKNYIPKNKYGNNIINHFENKINIIKTEIKTTKPYLKNIDITSRTDKTDAKYVLSYNNPIKFKATFNRPLTLKEEKEDTLFLINKDTIDSYISKNLLLNITNTDNNDNGSYNYKINLEEMDQKKKTTMGITDSDELKLYYNDTSIDNTKIKHIPKNIITIDYTRPTVVKFEIDKPNLNKKEKSGTVTLIFSEKMTNVKKQHIIIEKIGGKVIGSITDPQNINSDKKKWTFTFTVNNDIEIDDTDSILKFDNNLTDEYYNTVAQEDENLTLDKLKYASTTASGSSGATTAPSTSLKIDTKLPSVTKTEFQVDKVDKDQKLTVTITFDEDVIIKTGVSGTPLLKAYSFEKKEVSDSITKVASLNKIGESPRVSGGEIILVFTNYNRALYMKDITNTIKNKDISGNINISNLYIQDSLGNDWNKNGQLTTFQNFKKK